MICHDPDIWRALRDKQQALREKQRGFLLNPFRFGGGGGGGTDPNFANVVTLLHFDGSNGSTTITDNAPTPKTWTCFNSSQLSTVQQKFGPTSLSQTTANSRIEAPDDVDWDFGTGDFTIEAWVYTTTIAAGQGVIISRQEGGANMALQFRRNAAALDFIGRNTGGGGLVTVTASGFFAVNTWYHAAACRSGTTLRIFKDGTQVASGTVTNNFDSNRQMVVGAVNDGTVASSFIGYIDDVRMTKGVARYTANFTAPTAAFPDS